MSEEYIRELFGNDAPDEVVEDSTAVDGAAETETTDDGQVSVSNDTEQPEVIENDNANEDPNKGQSSDNNQHTDSNGLILGKFKNMGALTNSANYLANKLGVQFNADEYTSDADLVAAYQELERKQSRKIIPTNPTTQTQQMQANPELDAIKQQLSQIQNHLNPQPDEIDINNMTREQFEQNCADKGVSFVYDFIQSASKILGSQIGQMIKPMSDQYNSGQQQGIYNQVVGNVANRHEDFKEHVETIKEICQENPGLQEIIERDPIMGEQWMEVIYQRAVAENTTKKQRELLTKQAEQLAKQEQEKINKQKNGARLPNGGSKAPLNQGNKTSERQYIDDLFGCK